MQVVVSSQNKFDWGYHKEVGVSFTKLSLLSELLRVNSLSFDIFVYDAIRSLGVIYFLENKFIEVFLLKIFIKSTYNSMSKHVN